MIWIIYIAVVVTILAVALFVAKRKKIATQITSFDLPTYINRNDFAVKKADVLVIVFSSQHCDGCEAVWNKVKVLESESVDIIDVSYQDTTGKKLHTKYQIDAVPSVLICDSKGIVDKTFLGNVSATDLWAGVAQLRGSEISNCE